MSKIGDDVKHLFAHLGLDPEDYRELNPVNDADGDESEPADKRAGDDSPHVDLTQDDGERDAPEKDSEAVLDDAVPDGPKADLPDADEVPTPDARKPPTIEAQREEPPQPLRDAQAQDEPAAETGPERWSLLSQFEDPAGAVDDADIEGVDDEQWPAIAPEPALPPRVQDEPHEHDGHAQGPADDDKPGVLERARRLFGRDTDAETQDQETAWQEASPDAPQDRSDADAVAGQDVAAEEFWDEVAPQGGGDVDIDAVIARAQSEPADDAPPAREPVASPTPAQAPDAPPAPPPRPEPEAAPRATPAQDSALGGLMERLRAGPAEREARSPRLHLELDAPEREPASGGADRDTSLDSVFARLKRMRRE